MRLACEGEQPIDRYCKHKINIDAWYKELEEANLNCEDVKFLEYYLLKTYGIADTQEAVMELTLGIGFTLVEANKLRKAIARANAKDTIKEIKDLFYERGKSNYFSKELLDYIWDKQIAPQLGYAFSRNHTLPYTAILMQEMNLAYNYGSVWWKTACLSENIGNAGSMATAIGKMNGIVINPDINLSDLVFKPLEEEGKILFGLTSIDGIGEEVAKEIIENRPYNNIDDVLEKLIDTNKISILNLFKLAKAGCFDRISGFSSRRDVLIELIRKTVKTKEKLTMSNLPKLINKIPKELYAEKQLYEFKCSLKKADKEDGYYLLNIEQLDRVASIGVNFDVVGENIKINIKELDKFFKTHLANLKAWLSSEEALNLYNAYLLNSAWMDYCMGNVFSWEMETISFYSNGHELDDYDLSKYYLVSNFNDLSKTPVLDPENKSKYNIYKLSTIAGTVLDKNKARKLVYILTQHGVVAVKLTDYDFAKYDKKIVRINGKEKEILDDSWFKKGTLLIVHGYRRENDFVAKVYKRNNYKALAKIRGIKNSEILIQRDKIRE